MAGLRPSDGLLEQVAAYTAEAVSALTANDLSAPTPCAQWDLLSLLRHVNRSLGYIIASLEYDGSPVAVAVGPARSRQAMLDGDAAEVIAAAVLHRTERLVRVHKTIRAGRRPAYVPVGDRLMARELVAATGAVEIAVHAWDVATSCGRVLPIPDAPATELLELSAPLLDGVRRHGLFDPPVPVLPHARPGDRLVALLGRDPC